MIRRLTAQDLADLGIPDPAEIRHDWARCPLDRIGQGSQAMIFVHPHDPDLVIRFSKPMDGWVPYVIAASGSPFAPRLDALCFAGGAWIAVTERLLGIGDHVPGWDFSPRDLCEDVLAGIMGAGSEGAEAAFPGISAFAKHRLSDADDLRAGNLMLRGEQLVINDPFVLAGPGIGRIMDEFEITMPEPEESLTP